MSDKPTISVIVPVYNAERFLPMCLDSILSQDYTHWEAILVDDGSRDASPELCDAYARKDPRIKVFHTQNGGVSSARNFGLNKAMGEWVFFLDADDRMKPDALSKMLEKADGNDLVFGGYEVFDEQGNLTYAIKNREACMMDKYQALEQMFRPWHYRYYGYVWGKLFRMATLAKYGLRFNESITFNEDRLFTVSYICKVDKVAYFTTPVYEYIENSSSAMGALSRSFNSKFFTDLDAFRIMKKELRKLPDSGELLQMMNSNAGYSFRRLSQMLREQGETGVMLRIRLYAKMLKLLSFKEFCEMALLPFLFSRIRTY